MKVKVRFIRNARIPCSFCSSHDRMTEGGWITTSYKEGREQLCNKCMGKKYPGIAVMYRMNTTPGKNFTWDFGPSKGPTIPEEMKRWPGTR